MLDYSVVIPAFNEQEFLPATLTALGRAMASMPGRGEVIVTDNGSTDATAQVALSMGARVVHEPHRQISRSRNAGGRAARGDCLVFVDADTLVTPAALRNAVEAVATGRFVGGGARMLFDVQGHLDIALSLGVWTILSKFLRWAAGGFIFCRRDAFEDIGGFDERYYIREELYLSRALRHWGARRGMGFIVLSDAVVTSARKIRWYSRAEIRRMTLPLLLSSRRARSREHCRMWYERPE